MSDDKLEAFMREGLVRYPEAFNTIRYFEQKLQGRIQDLLEKKKDWTSFRLSKSNIEKFTKTGAYTYAEASGVVNGKHQAILQVGVWWLPRALKSPVIVYAQFSMSKHPCIFEGEQANHRVKLFDDYGYTHTYVEPTQDSTLEADVNLVVDELQRLASAAAKP